MRPRVEGRVPAARRSSPSFAGLAAVMATALAIAPTASAGTFFIVVNHANSTASLSRSEIKKIMTGGIKQWDSGAVVQLGIIPGEAPETQYLASLLDMTVGDLIARIQEQVFKGDLRRPVTLRSSADCVAFARSNPGGFCVVSESEPLTPEVHAIAVH